MSVFDSIFGGGGGVSMPDPMSYLPLIQASADINRLDQSSPFGGIRYNTDAPTPLSFDEWQTNNPGPTQPTTGAGGMFGPNRLGGTGKDTGMLGAGQMGGINQAPAYDPNAAYDSYVSNFQTNNPGQTSVEQYFSPEFESLFTKQFDPSGYDQYKNDYMDEFDYRTGREFERQDDRFAQSMFDRGQPVGGELYNDEFLLKERAQNDALTSATRTGQQYADQARMSDFNKLMAAMGGSQVGYSPIDTMGPANMAMNANVANAQNSANNSSNIWNTITGAGSAYLLGGF